MGTGPRDVDPATPGEDSWSAGGRGPDSRVSVTPIEMARASRRRVVARSGRKSGGLSTGAGAGGGPLPGGIRIRGDHRDEDRDRLARRVDSARGRRDRPAGFPAAPGTPPRSGSGESLRWRERTGRGRAWIARHRRADRIHRPRRSESGTRPAWPRTPSGDDSLADRAGFEDASGSQAEASRTQSPRSCKGPCRRPAPAGAAIEPVTTPPWPSRIRTLKADVPSRGGAWHGQATPVKINPAQ
jgi:hypothetical protein